MMPRAKHMDSTMCRYTSELDVLNNCPYDSHFVVWEDLEVRESMVEPDSALVGESKSSVEIKENAKGEPQVTVKIYRGDGEALVKDAAKLAVKMFRYTQKELAK